jgi:hypothetical protein
VLCVNGGTRPPSTEELRSMSSSSRFGRLATSALAFLRRYDWLAFLLQQVLVFTLAVVLLQGARLLTGKSIHLGMLALGTATLTATPLLRASLTASRHRVHCAPHESIQD